MAITQATLRLHEVKRSKAFSTRIKITDSADSLATNISILGAYPEGTILLLGANFVERDSTLEDNGSQQIVDNTEWITVGQFIDEFKDNMAVFNQKMDNNTAVPTEVFAGRWQLPDENLKFPIISVNMQCRLPSGNGQGTEAAEMGTSVLKQSKATGKPRRSVDGTLRGGLSTSQNSVVNDLVRRAVTKYACRDATGRTLLPDNPKDAQKGTGPCLQQGKDFRNEFFQEGERHSDCCSRAMSVAGAWCSMLGNCSTSAI
jgi:hypothetical protein